MSRNRQVEAIVLRNYRIGEHHKGVVLFARGEGLITAIAHGAYKGRLKVGTGLFSRGLFYLYTDPVKQSTKVSDVEPRQEYGGLHHSLDRYFAACLWAEILLSSFGGGEVASDEDPRIYELVSESLALLDGADSRGVHILSAQFTWRFVTALGLRPDVSLCADTGANLDKEDAAYYSRSDGQIHSGSAPSDRELDLRPGTRGYLRYTESRPLEEALGVAITDGTLGNLRRFLRALLSDTVDAELRTLKVADPL